MDPGQPPRGDVPFDCNFDGISNNPSLQPPPGPHGPDLLNNNETHLLDNFWQNPNDVDPSFLSLPTGYEGCLGASYGDTNFGWHNTSSAPIAHNTAALLRAESYPASVVPMETFSRGLLGLTGGSAAPVQDSDDVWAAASLLHHNAASVRAQQTDALNYAARAGRAPMQLSSYGYSQVPSSISPYNLAGPSTLNGFYDPLQPVQVPGSAYMPDIPGGLHEWNGNSRRGPLRFGSDDNFSSRNYATFDTEAPDRQLRATMVYNLEHAEDPATAPNTQPSTPNNAKRKRRRPSPRMVETPDSRVEEQIAEDKKSCSKRRRKVEAQQEDEKDVEKTSSRTKGSKRRSSSPPKKAGGRKPSATVSPGKRRKSSPIAGKSGRENLSEEQKRSNHIQSEQKRRNLIKQGFEDINTMVPELRPGGFSKSNMLFEAAKFMRNLRDGNEELRAQMESLDHG